jgi:endonuclease G
MKKFLVVIFLILFSFISLGQDLRSVSFGIPVKFDYYTILFNKDKKQASFATYKLTKDMLEKKVSRKNSFHSSRKDLNHYTVKAYKGSGFHRGHLVPAADMLFSDSSLYDTFDYLNITFQYPSFNLGIWKKLEIKVREKCLEYDTIYVVTGPVFNNGEDDVYKMVPDKFFKVLLIKNGDLYNCVGYLIPNLKNKGDYKPLSIYMKSVDDIEFITGFDFFWFVPDHIENEIEKEIDYAFWVYKKE